MIIIKQTVDGKFYCQSKFSDRITADILIDLAKNFIRQDERKRIEQQSQSQLINPHTGSHFKVEKKN